MRHFLAVLLLAFVAAGLHAESVLPERTVDILDVVYAVRDGKRVYTAAVIYSDDHLATEDLGHARLRVVRVKAQTTDDGLYDDLQSMHDDQKFDCLIVIDRTLTWEQLIQAEQFAREHQLVIVSTAVGVGSTPFVVDKVNNEVFYRLPAVDSYKFLKPPRQIETPMKNLGFAKLVHDPRCTPAPGWIHNDYPSMTCQHNAIELIDSNDRARQPVAIREISVAQMHDADENSYHPIHERSWGLTGYHPHYVVAKAMSRIGRCKTMTREFRLSTYSADTKQLDQLTAVCRQVTMRNSEQNGEPLPYGWSVVQLAPARDGGRQDPLPPFHPQLNWTELFVL